MRTNDNKSPENKINNNPGKTKEKNIDKTKAKAKDAKRPSVGKASAKKSKKAKPSEIEELGNKLSEINDKYLRLSAEFDNYRKRTLKEKMDLTRTGGESILINILPVVDNLERAIESVKIANDIGAVKEGINLIYNNFKEFLVQNGVKEIESKNKKFDTDIHEAISKIPVNKKSQKGKVVDVVEKGYYLHDKVVRFAKVVIGE